MKSLKTLAVGLLASAGISGAASAAPTIVHLVGSTAFRAPATAAIIDSLSNGGTTKVYAAYSGGSLLGSGAALIANGTIGSSGTATVVVETYFTGSLAGVVDLRVGNNTGAYLSPNDSTVITAANGSTVTTSPFGGGTAVSGVATVTSAPDIAMSDSYKNTIGTELGSATLTGTLTGSHGTFTSISSLAAAVQDSTVVDGGTTGNAADASFVGIVPFEWVAGNGSPATASNMSQQQARGLITSGFIPQPFLTGNPADEANYFYLVGRNEDSGTRIGAFSESQFGVAGTPQQYQFNGTTANLYPITPLNTEPLIVWNTAGHSGYVSGGNVGSALNLAGGTVNFTSGKSPENTGSSFFIGYLGLTDAATVTAGTAHALAYGGIGYSEQNVEIGHYTFWTYEHSYHLSSLAGTALTTADTIADNIYNTDADVAGNGTHAAGTTTVSAGLLDNPNSAVLVKRNLTEGFPITNY